jgi:hypothetical protein
MGVLTFFQVMGVLTFFILGKKVTEAPGAVVAPGAVIPNGTLVP